MTGDGTAENVKEPLAMAVLASGRGTNFEALADSIDRREVKGVIRVVISDKPDAPVLTKARKRGIPAVYINPSQFSSKELYEEEISRICQEYQVDLIVLAGYMRILGESFVNRFPFRIINIHPALLPSFPGLHAQRQALEYGVRFTGCTVHFVDAGVDTGPIILQQVVPVLPDDDEETLTQRILKEEHKLLPQAVQLLAEGRLKIVGRRVIILPKEGDK